MLLLAHSTFQISYDGSPPETSISVFLSLLVVQKRNIGAVSEALALVLSYTICWYIGG